MKCSLIYFVNTVINIKAMKYPSEQPSRGVLKKGFLEICSKFTGEQPCQIALRYGCSPVNLVHIFRTPFPKNTSGWLLLIHVRSHRLNCDVTNDFMRHLLSSKSIKLTIQANAVTSSLFFLFGWVFFAEI